MTIVSQIYVGIDVSKDTLDGAVLGEKNTAQFANTKKGMAKLVKRMRALNPNLMVVEATGGYEEVLVLALFEANLPVALVKSPAGETICASKRTTCQDRPTGCPPSGGIWTEDPTAPVCGQE